MVGLISPALALAAVLSTAYATLFHLWQKGEMPALRKYLIAAWLGFAAGHLASDFSGLHVLQIGHLNALSGTIGAVVALLIARSLET